MVKLFITIDGELKRLQSEVDFHLEAGIVSVKELRKIVGRTTQFARMTQAWPDIQNSTIFLDWIRAMNLDLATRRQMHEYRQRLARRLDKLLQKHEVPKERCTIYYEKATSFGTRRDAERWLEHLEAELDGRCICKSSTFVTAVSVTKPTEPEHQTSVLEEEFRLRYLRERASMVKMHGAHSLYSAGLAATGRREKIRLFKAAIHEEVRGL